MPNSVIDLAVVININFTEIIYNYMNIDIGYGTDMEKATSFIQKAFVGHEVTLNIVANPVTANGYTQNLS